MTAHALTHRAQAAYGAGSSAVRTPRSTEYAVFARITRRIKHAAERGRPGFAELAAALHENQQLWLILSLDVASDANGLPIDLRASLLGLAEFTRKHTAAVLQNKADVRPILEINVAVMKGLAGQGNPT